MRKMPKTEIAAWVRTWGSSRRGVEIDLINSLDDLRDARRFCSVMRLGLFTYVSDETLFNAIVADRVTRGTMSVRRAAREIGGSVEDVSDVLVRHGHAPTDM